MSRQILYEGRMNISSVSLGMTNWAWLGSRDLLFLANVLRYVRYMLSAVRLSSVCRLSVTLVHPTQPAEVFGNFFHHTIAQ